MFRGLGSRFFLFFSGVRVYRETRVGFVGFLTSGILFLVSVFDVNFWSFIE